MTPEEIFSRYEELRRYVGWTEEDAQRVKSLAPAIAPNLDELVTDFYDEIERHPNARKVITGGAPQIERLKGSLLQWLEDLFSGVYDRSYVFRRWRVGYRHVEIGLDQVYTNVALSRLRNGLHQALESNWLNAVGTPGHALREVSFSAAVRSLDKLLDLDLAIIEDAYQAEYLARQQRAERLAAIGQIAGGVAHELRNPLNVIKTSAYYLLNARNPSSEKTAEHLGRIEKQVGLADGVITALSNFAKMPLPSLQPVNVEALVRETLEVNELPPDVAVDVDCPSSLPPALVDKNQMLIVLGNLVRNARDAMPNGGRLQIAACDGDGHVDLRVTDTGHGIPAEDLHRVMEPLFTTKARGIGLGLAMARTLAQKNEGDLSVQSQVGVGTTFTLRLRAADKQG